MYKRTLGLLKTFANVEHIWLSEHFPSVYLVFFIHFFIHLGAFCLRMRENRSVRLQMAGFKGFVSFVMVFMKNVDWIFVRSLRIRVNPTQVRVLVLLQFNSFSKIHGLSFTFSSFARLDAYLYSLHFYSQLSLNM
jgi:hypothetical protein